MTRLETIPTEAVKMATMQATWPPIPAPGWSQPLPLGAPINTAGDQIGEGVTGIWQATHSEDDWLEPHRVVLAVPDQLDLDGCSFGRKNFMAFCSIRAGNQRAIKYLYR